MYIYKDKGKWTAAFAPGSIWETHPVAWSLVPWAPIFLGWWDNMWDIDVYKYDTLCGILWVFIVRGGMELLLVSTCWIMFMPHVAMLDAEIYIRLAQVLRRTCSCRILTRCGFCRQVGSALLYEMWPVAVTRPGTQYQFPDWLRLVDSRRQM